MKGAPGEARPFGRAQVAERLALKSTPEPNTGCLLWFGNIDANGYGKIMDAAGRIDWVHRVAYRTHVGPIPDGFEVDHLCRLPCCIQPRHLEAVTPYVNQARSSSPPAKNSRKTHCYRGHEFTPENTIVRTRRGHTQRWCRICKKLLRPLYRRA